jgi:surface carbohydrate biosynthesis protein
MKLSFENIRKIDVLLLDKNFSQIRFKGLKTKIFDYRKVNLIILIKALLGCLLLKESIFNLKKIYLKKLLISLRPKVIIGNNFNQLIFSIKNIYNKAKVVLYLHNRLYEAHFNLLKKLSKKSKIDYFFVCDDLHKKRISKFIKTNFIVNGLTKNNEIKLKKKKKKYDIMFISEYRNSEYTKKEKHFYFMKYIIKNLDHYAFLRKKKIIIALNSSRKEKKINFNNEINFFTKISKNVLFDIKKNSYELANQSELIVCLNSNLGAELLSRKFKVLFLPYLYNYGLNYKNPYFSKKLFFVHRSLDKNFFFKKIDKMLSLNKKKWSDILNKSNIKIMFNKNNTILKKKIFEIILKNRGKNN